MWINLKNKMRESSTYRTEYSKTLDSALEDSLELCKEPKKDWNGKVKKVCVILTSSRGGSSLMKEVLSSVGFTDIQKTTFKKGMMEELLVDCENHEWQSLYIEGRKQN